MRFGAARRVKKRPEFQSIQSAGRRLTTAHFVLIVAPGPNPEGAARLGITASRRFGCSVRRSRIKRLLREAFRLDPDFLPPGYDLVVICRRDAPLMLADVTAEWQAARPRLLRLLATRSKA